MLPFNWLSYTHWPWIVHTKYHRDILILRFTNCSLLGLNNWFKNVIDRFIWWYFFLINLYNIQKVAELAYPSLLPWLKILKYFFLDFGLLEIYLFFFFLLFLFFVKRNILTDNILIHWFVFDGNIRRLSRARGLLFISFLFKHRMFIKNRSTSLTNYRITCRHLPKLFKNIKFYTHNICVNFLFIMSLWLDFISHKLLLL